MIDTVKSGEDSWRVQAECVAALDERLQLRPKDSLARMERIARDPGIGALSARIQSEVAAELGRSRLAVGDLRGADSELRHCQELFVKAQVAPSPPVTSCFVGRAQLALHAGRSAEAEQLLLPLAASWERVNPDGPGRGEVLHWLARAEQGLGRTAEARRDAQLADTLLRRSAVPALRRLLPSASVAR